MANDKIEIFVEDREEIPTSVNRKIKVLEMPVFTESDKKNIEKMMDRLDRFMSDTYSERASLNDLRGDMQIVGEDLKNVSDELKTAGTMRNVNEERIVVLLGRAVQSIEALNQAVNDLKISVKDVFNERLGVLDNKFEEKLYALDSTISYMKGMLIDATEKIDSLAGVSETKMALLVENISEKFDAYIANLNNRLDNMVLQVIEPLNDMSMRLEDIKKPQDTDKVISRLDILIKDVDSLKRFRPKIRIPKLPTNAFEMLAEAKKQIRSKRVSKKKQPEKKRLMAGVDLLENRVLDLFIFSAIGAKRQSITAIKKEIPVGEAKIRKRIAELVRRDNIKKGRRGKLVVYYVG